MHSNVWAYVMRFVWPWKGPFFCLLSVRRLFGAGIFRHRFRAFGDGVFRQLPGQDETQCSLDFPSTDRRAFVDLSKTRRFVCYSLKNIPYKGIHNGHGVARDPCIGMNLLQDFVDVAGEGFLPRLFPFLFISRLHWLWGLTGFFHSLSRCLTRHDDCQNL